MDTSQRLHSLDNLRAAMMWLGIVLHVAAQHIAGFSPLPWRDTATTPWADLLVALIHTFRMPVFFIVAGFFAALLVQRRGLRGMLSHRFQRVALPFLVFWPPIAFGMTLLVLVYLYRSKTGDWGLDLTLRPEMGNKPLLNTMHLWFLYQLWWFVVLTAVVGTLAKRLPAACLEAPARLLRRLGGAWWGFIVLALPLAAVGAAYPHGIVAPMGSLLPPLAEWVHNGLFFAFGLALFGARGELLAWYTRRHLAFLLAGLPFFLASGALMDAAKRGAALPLAEAWIALAYNAATWLWSLGLIGAFLRYLPQRNAVLGYLSESSYWVYLVHMLGTVGFGALVFGWPVAAGWKMLANIALTTAFALASYQLLVRHTWVGRLLNGPRPAPPGTAHGTTQAVQA
ncbi:MAG: acyltransferase family protein [Burkholderiales bacterium]|nr:acyltransferase family protein [Burkholderiales bacterium]